MTFIRPVEFSGLVQRTNDVSGLKQQEDNKPLQDQSNVQQTVHKHTQHMMHEVAAKDNSDREQTSYDAKEKGRNEYVASKQKKKNKQQSKDKMVTREPRGFDIKI